MTKYEVFISKLLLTIKSIIKILLKFRIAKFPKVDLINNEIVVVGNGPSLSKTLNENRDLFENKEIFCVNYFAENEEFVKIKPRLYILIDPNFYVDNVTEEVRKKRQNLFSILIKDTSWDLNLFIPYEAKKYNRNYSILTNNEHIKIHYVNLTGLDGFNNFIYLAYRLNMGMPRTMNVIIPALIISMKLNFKKIYLVGADHDLINHVKVGSDNKIYLSQNHFYDNEPGEKVVVKSILKRGEDINLVGFLKSQLVLFNSYMQIEKIAERFGVKIINKYSNSFIDSFEKE